MRERLVVAWLMLWMIIVAGSQILTTDHLGKSLWGGLIFSLIGIVPFGALLWIADIVVQTKESWKSQIRQEAINSERH